VATAERLPEEEEEEEAEAAAEAADADAGAAAAAAAGGEGVQQAWICRSGAGDRDRGLVDPSAAGDGAARWDSSGVVTKGGAGMDARPPSASARPGGAMPARWGRMNLLMMDWSGEVPPARNGEASPSRSNVADGGRRREEAGEIDLPEQRRLVL